MEISRRFYAVSGPCSSSRLLDPRIACPLALLRSSLTPALVLFTAHSAVLCLCLLSRLAPLDSIQQPFE